MSPRIKVLRKVSNPPVIKGFKPYGMEAEKRKPQTINLLYEEYEALRLSDYNKYNHHQASVMMGVSRPTFTRIYASALQKIAIAFVEGKQIAIEGGKVYFDSNWYHCKQCNCNFNNPEKEKTIEQCPLCGSSKIKEYNNENFKENTDDSRCKDLCICPVCGYEQEHQLGKPCNHESCPVCSNTLKRKGRSDCRNYQ